MKVMTIVGTRPEIIRLSRVMLALDEVVEHVVVHTGQNWDPQLKDVFFKELGLREPDHRLDIDTSSLGRVMGGILSAIEPVLIDEHPDAVLVLGDTNSCIAALMAKRLGIPVFHMEAGNRCFDENVPEETNRKLIDHIADFNLCYTEHARRNLLAEGLHPRQVFVTGSPMAEVLDIYRANIEASDVVEWLELKQGEYLLVSMHREENVDNPVNLNRLLGAIVNLQQRYDCRVVVSTHPRLRKRLASLNSAVNLTGIEFLEPFGYLDFNKLQLNARCVLSDSGTVSEESSILGFPAITIRNAMERPEALDSGSIVISGLEPAAIQRCVELVTDQWQHGHKPSVPIEYTWLDCSSRVVRLIVGLSAVRNRWQGIEPRPVLGNQKDRGTP